MERWSVVVGLALSAVLSAACQGRPVPLSAQAGSTITIPLTTGNDPSTLIGSGGTAVTDYQRGTLVFRLDSFTGQELVTRGTSVVAASPNSLAARGGTLAGPLQVVALVDIPASAPVGLHNLTLKRRRIESGVPVEYDFPATYNGQIQILPNQLTVPLPGGGSSTITGSPTPFEAYFGAWADITTQIQKVAPDPELRLSLNQGVWALEMTVSYAPSVMSVLDVIEPPTSAMNHLATVWYGEANPQSPGTLLVKAVAGSGAFSELSLVFSLVNGSTAILDPNAPTVTITKAYDQNGAAVSASVSSRTIH
jgi:hypothetical protein